MWESCAYFPTAPRRLKRKELKKVKRKRQRQLTAERDRLNEEMRLQDPVEQLKMRLQEQREAQALEKDRLEREEQERLWFERERKAQEETERRKREEEEKKTVKERDSVKSNEGDEGWEYVEEGPAEIIWQGNEIIVRKRRVKVPRAAHDVVSFGDDANRPTSNPLPPQSAVFAEHKNHVASHAISTVYDAIEQNPNFGTEQDKTHCPFHIKTGVCRFGVRCSRAHVYPEKSCTLLMKNMYNGPGLAWEHDEGLEYTDEEIAEHYREFYDDVHSEFLKFGELINFKVCRNASSHLRGNVYVHYQSLDSAVAAYNGMNGRFYAGKQITCEFVGVTRWKVAICGEYMKAHHRSCSRGTHCNFLHCFRNPRGEYEWVEWDAPPPRSWQAKMDKLFNLKRGECLDAEGDFQDDYCRTHRRHMHEYKRRHLRSTHSYRRHRSQDTSSSTENEYKDQWGYSTGQNMGSPGIDSVAKKKSHDCEETRNYRWQYRKKNVSSDDEHSFKRNHRSMKRDHRSRSSYDHHHRKCSSSPCTDGHSSEEVTMNHRAMKRHHQSKHSHHHRHRQKGSSPCVDEHPSEGGSQYLGKGKRHRRKHHSYHNKREGKRNNINCNGDKTESSDENSSRQEIRDRMSSVHNFYNDEGNGEVREIG